MFISDVVEGPIITAFFGLFDKVGSVITTAGGIIITLAILRGLWIRAEESIRGTSMFSPKSFEDEEDDAFYNEVMCNGDWSEGMTAEEYHDIRTGWDRGRAAMRERGEL